MSPRCLRALVSAHYQRRWKGEKARKIHRDKINFRQACRCKTGKALPSPTSPPSTPPSAYFDINTHTTTSTWLLCLTCKCLLNIENTTTINVIIISSRWNHGKTQKTQAHTHNLDNYSRGWQIRLWCRGHRDVLRPPGLCECNTQLGTHSLSIDFDKYLNTRGEGEAHIDNAVR